MRCIACATNAIIENNKFSSNDTKYAYTMLFDITHDAPSIFMSGGKAVLIDIMGRDDYESNKSSICGIGAAILESFARLSYHEDVMAELMLFISVLLQINEINSERNVTIKATGELA